MKYKRLSKMDKKRIINKVNELLIDFGYNDAIDTYVDISKLAISHGFQVGESRKLPFKEDGFIFVFKDKKDLLIGVNDYRSFEEKRFIVAHELAHYFLHYKNSDLADSIMHRKHIKGKDEKENDADFFAACVLMPEKSFINQYKHIRMEKYSDTEIVKYLQTLFLTPKESIERRIHEVCNG